jgi:hypothetical protein
MARKEELTDFYQEFTQGIRLTQTETGLQYEETLVNEISTFMLDAGEIDELVYDHFLSSDRKVRVDAWGGPLSDDGQLRLFSVVSSQSKDLQTLTKKEVESEFSRLAAFVEACRDEKFVAGFDKFREVGQLAKEIHSSWDEIQKIRFCLITDKKISQRLDGMPAKSIDGTEVSHSVWDIQRLADFVTSGKGREELSVQLKTDFGVEIPALRAAADFASYDAYLLVLPGDVLARIYDRFDTRLLESNVRVFLQAKGGVNKGIRDTIENFPEKFLAFNNGVTATASQIETCVVGGQTVIRSIDDLQIVNGGQTTASIHAAFRKKIDLSRVFVQMKLSVIGQVSDDDLVADISKFANSQNKVSEADFFSNHPYHKRMEKFSREIYAPTAAGSFVQTKWFYERARGQYLDMLARARSRTRAEAEYPKKQVFVKTDHAKFEMTFWGKPHLVSKGAQHNFRGFASEITKRWDSSDAQFDRLHYEACVARAILFRTGEKIVSDASWYDGGYRAQAVTYTWAKIAHDLAQDGLRLNFESIWQDQSLADVVAKQFNLTAQKVYAVLFEPVPGVSNIGELAKREDFWNKLKSREFNYESQFTKWCVSKTRTSRREKAVAQGTSDSVRYSMTSPSLCKELLEQCERDHIGLTPTERGILARMSTGPVLLTASQTRALKTMFSRIKDKIPSRLVF